MCHPGAKESSTMNVPVPATAHSDTMPPGPREGFHAPVLGEDVFYVLKNGARMGEERSAKVVRAVPSGDVEMGIVRLAVFTDGTEDGLFYQTCPTIVESRWSPDGEPGTWHRD